ncbi:MAG: hypothetical protein ACRDD1_18845, partial [Planctomycetia bacterium]
MLIRSFGVAAALAVSLPALAAMEFDQNVVPGVIFGSGNANGSWTVDRNTDEGLELGLRAKVRFPVPLNVFNSNGAGVYTFQAEAATSGAPWITAQTPIWNFEFSINSNTNGSGGFLDSYVYLMSLDFDPAVGVESGPEFQVLSPITHPPDGFTIDHSFGDNTTTELTDTKGTLINFAALVASTNVA